MAQPSPLHERTVAMICKALEGAYSSTHRGRAEYNEHRLTRCAVRLRVGTGEFSGDLAEGVAKVKVPDPDWDSVGGIVPDIILYDSDDKPVRIVEVIVTNPPDERKRSKIEALKRRGVDVVEVTVKAEEDLFDLLATLPKREYLGLRSKRPDDNASWEYGARWPSIEGNNYGRRTDDEFVEELARRIYECSPAVRRELADALRGIDSLESLYPVDD